MKFRKHSRTQADMYQWMRRIHGEDTKLIDIMPDKQEKMPDMELLKDSLRIEIDGLLIHYLKGRKKS